MTDSYRQITDVRYSLVDLLDWLWRRSPLPPDQAEQITTRLLAPMGAVPACLHARFLYEAITDGRQSDFDTMLGRAVSDLLHMVGSAVLAEWSNSADASLRRIGLLPQSTPPGGAEVVSGPGGTGPDTTGGDGDG